MTRRRRDVPYWLHPLYLEARRRRERERRRRLALAYAFVLTLWGRGFSGRQALTRALGVTTLV